MFMRLREFYTLPTIVFAFPFNRIHHSMSLLPLFLDSIIMSQLSLTQEKLE